MRCVIEQSGRHAAPFLIERKKHDARPSATDLGVEASQAPLASPVHR
jgi:hypothetical protein